MYNLDNPAFCGDGRHFRYSYAGQDFHLHFECTNKGSHCVVAHEVGYDDNGNYDEIALVYANLNFVTRDYALFAAAAAIGEYCSKIGRGGN